MGDEDGESITRLLACRMRSSAQRHDGKRIAKFFLWLLFKQRNKEVEDVQDSQMTSQRMRKWCLLISQRLDVIIEKIWSFCV